MEAHPPPAFGHPLQRGIAMRHLVNKPDLLVASYPPLEEVPEGRRRKSLKLYKKGEMWIIIISDIHKITFFLYQKDMDKMNIYSLFHCNNYFIKS